MLNFSSRALLALSIFVCVTSAYGQTKVVVIPMFGDDAASKWRGAWVDETAYKKSDIIEFDGSSYIAVSDHQSSLSNIPPGDGLWNVVAASGANGGQGDQGETGTKGETGAQGDRGIQGDQGMTGPQGTAANAVDAICVALGATAGCDLVKILAPEAPSKLVFVTSTLQNGNLGGLPGANNICQGLAADQNIQGVFKAWLSDSTGSPDTGFKHASIPYALVDGTVIAANYEGLVSSPLQSPIRLTETGANLGDAAVVYTNTDASGREFDYMASCNDWRKTTAEGIAGLTGAVDSKWTAQGYARCEALNRMYCFEQ
jgi:hypothetical protein